jgi:putative tryptophan/tyrosine transport system substrate-binding protein
MDRRAFISGATLSLLVAPRAAKAQPARLPRIGVLTTASSASSPSANYEAFVQGLRESGYIEGRNVLLEQRYAEERPKLFPALAADLVRLNVDLIFARGPWAVAAATSATKTIPIVGVDLETDPVANGLVKSLARPGGNLTGMFLDLAELSGKQLQILKEINPRLSRVAVLGDSAVNSSQLKELRIVAESAAVQIQPLEMKTAKDLTGAFEAENKRPSDALIVLSNPLTLAARSQIAGIAAKRRLPSMYLYGAHVEAGGLLSYGPNLPDMFRRCGVYAARILGGQRPADLPLERPTKFEMVLNLKTAKALGLTIPPSLLQRADQVIE